jgi:hypothetical protein
MCPCHVSFEGWCQVSICERATWRPSIVPPGTIIHLCVPTTCRLMDGAKFQSVTGPHFCSWVVPHSVTWGCHVSKFHWPIWWPKVPNQHATWHVVIGPHQHDDITAMCLYEWHLSCTVWQVTCHVTVWTTMWYDPIGPRINLKMPNLGDMWLL